ncbi:MAG TPA: aldo/keto reductase [Symbiobacteriaceae bacterium]|nr:aldo/keto reductase [Symbiobacteriaceae bacterium]
MERRTLGKTGVELSCLGFGGMLVARESQAEANSLVARAIDRDINYFDVAPTYDDAEERLGPALEPYRNQVFLACKTQKRTKAEAEEALERSLRLLRADHFDLYQLHAMTTDEDYEQAMGPGGAMEALVAAREKGLVRYLGFSAHSDAIALKLMDAFDFDSILFPVNWVNYMQADFGPAVMEKARSKAMGRLCLKAMARSSWERQEDRVQFPKCWYEPCSDLAEAALALRFTLSEPVTAAIPPGDARLFWHAVDVAERFEPLSYAEREEMRMRAGQVKPLFASSR